MIGDLMATVGLILSGQGFVSSIRTGSKLKSIEQRLIEAERQLTAIIDDNAFVKSSLNILKDIDSFLKKLQCSPELDLKYAAPPEIINEFAHNPRLFGAQQFQPWHIFLRSIGNTPRETEEFMDKSIPIIFVDSFGEVKASSLPRHQI